MTDNQSQDVGSRERPQDWPLPRLLAFSTMLMTIGCLAVFVGTAILVNWVQPDLGKEPLVLPLMGAVLLSGTLIALLGVVAGIVDLTQSHDRRGVTTLSVAVNGLVVAFIFSITVIGFIS